MGASICWRPSDDNAKQISVGAPSTLIETMSKVGMRLPCKVTATDIPTLQGMAVVYGRNDQNPNPYQEILDLIEKYGSLDLWAEY